MSKPVIHGTSVRTFFHGTEVVHEPGCDGCGWRGERVADKQAAWDQAAAHRRANPNPTTATTPRQVYRRWSRGG